MVGRSITGLMSILVVGLMTTSTSALAGGERDRFECKNSGDGVTSMDARFEDRDNGDRRKFDVSFDTLPGGVLKPGAEFDVTVAGTIVGSITLAIQPAPDNDLAGDLEFDSNVDKDDPNDDTVDFPAGFPAVGAGTVVNVGTLGCTLQED